MKYINADKLKETIEIKLGFTHAIFNIIDELSEEREEVFEFINNCNISKEDWLVYLERETHNEVIENMIKSYINMSNRFKQPNPLKVAIKGDGTGEYGKKIIEYFKEHDIKNRFNHKCNNLFYYYGSEDENITFDCNLLEGYTEISLKEEGKVVIDNSKVNTYLLNRVEELEKELIDLKLKLKQNTLLEEDGKTLNKELEEVMSDRDDLAKRFIEFKDRENVILEASVKEMENRKRALINKILDFNNQYKNSISTIRDFKNGVHKACAQIISLVEKM